MTVKSLCAAMAAISALALSTLAAAAPKEQIGCIEENIDAEVLSRLTQAFFGGGQGKVSTSDEKAFRAVMRDCAKRYEWSEVDAKNAGFYAFSGASLQQSGEGLRGYGVSLDVLDTYAAKNYDHWKNVGLDEGINQEEIAGLMNPARTLPLDLHDEQAKVLVTYLMAAFLRMGIFEAFVAGEAFDYRHALRGNHISPLP